MFVPVILGSDKTTISVATSQNDYYPLYISTGNLHNNIRCSHRESVSLVRFLSIPTSEFISNIFQTYMNYPVLAERGYKGSKEYLHFRWHLFHASLRAILESFRPAMQKPEIVKCADGHFRRAVYGLGPYIADYPEQSLLSCTIQGWCPRLVYTLSCY